MSLAFLGLLAWILFGILFVIATLIAFTLRRLGRTVTREDILLLFTKSIGAVIFGSFCGLIAAVVADHYVPSAAWPSYLAAIVMGMGAAVLTWKFGKARIR